MVVGRGRVRALANASLVVRLRRRRFEDELGELSEVIDIHGLEFVGVCQRMSSYERAGGAWSRHCSAWDRFGCHFANPHAPANYCPWGAWCAGRRMGIMAILHALPILRG